MQDIARFKVEMCVKNFEVLYILLWFEAGPPKAQYNLDGLNSFKEINTEQNLNCRSSGITWVTWKYEKEFGYEQISKKKIQKIVKNKKFFSARFGIVN